MEKEFDLINEVVLVFDARMNLIDIFKVHGITRRDLPSEASFYTYRSLLTPELHCCLCGKPIEEVEQPCVSNSSHHAIVSRSPQEIPAHHRATSYQIDLINIYYDEFMFFVERDNLFPLSTNTQSDQGVEV